MFDAAGTLVNTTVTDAANHCWVTGLTPGTTYTYRVIVNDEEWAEGERWDWSPQQKALIKGGRYENRFRTYPDPATPATALAFAVIGDFGVGMKRESAVHRQQQIGDALRRALETHDVQLVLTT